MTQYLISFDATAMDHIPDADMPAELTAMLSQADSRRRRPNDESMS
jgi:hypothetical protein